MIEFEKSFGVWVAAVVMFIMADQQFHPVIVERALRDAKINFLLTSLFELQIRPGETARFISRVYPELIKQIANDYKNLQV